VRHGAVLLLALAGCSCSRQSETTATSVPRPRYYIIGKAGAHTLGANPRALLPGFGVVVQEQRMVDGELVGHTSLGRDIVMKDLRPATPSRFSGVHLDGRNLDFGWVVKENAALYAEPDVAGKVIARRARYSRLSLVTREGPQGFYRVTDGWITEADLRVHRPSPRPPVVADGEPWIDVELASQTLVAYVGDKPEFSTLVTTGVGAEGSPLATPKGLHRIGAKLLATTMDNLEHTGVAPYSYEEVPFTQYIGRVALHGAFWHDQFGVVRSHGCINLSPTDAEWLFHFTKPVLPDGDTQIAASGKHPGTVVRVR